MGPNPFASFHFQIKNGDRIITKIKSQTINTENYFVFLCWTQQNKKQNQIKQFQQSCGNYKTSSQLLLSLTICEDPNTPTLKLVRVSE